MKITEKKIEKILSDNKTSKKVSMILNIRQQERFLETEKERLRIEANNLENQITAKYELGFIDVALLISELEKKGYVDWYKKYIKQKRKRNE